MLDFAVERWGDVLPEMGPLFDAHYREVASDQGRVPLALDLDAFAALDHAGMLLLVTARHVGKLAGYLLAVVRPHHHYAETLHGCFDLYYLAPEHRRGPNGIALFRFAEAQLRDLGVRKLIGAAKTGRSPTGRPLDVSAIFQRLGWAEEERGFGKVLV